MTSRKNESVEARQVQAAWRKTKKAWVRLENSLLTMVDADKALFHALGDAGNKAAKQARKELDSAVKTLDQSRKRTVKKIEKLIAQNTPDAVKAKFNKPGSKAA